ncbi:MAG: hypothetical protein Fur006_34300 [Coleofasciculaceae cyanobacterium]
MTTLLEITKELNKNQGASENALNQFMMSSGIKLPEQYLEFMRISNGTEGFIGENSYLILWPIEQIGELNEAYAVAEFAPGLLVFGSNGGDIAYAFDTRSEKMQIVEVPFIGMNLDNVKLCGTTFNSFLDYLYSLQKNHSR